MKTATAVRVADASALAAVVFGEADAHFVQDRLFTADLASPHILPFEMGSVCWKKIRRHPEQAAILYEALSRFTRIPIVLYPVNALDAVSLALDLRISAYDASYVWLARNLGIELVTLDVRLARAAGH